MRLRLIIVVAIMGIIIAANPASALPGGLLDGKPVKVGTEDAYEATDNDYTTYVELIPGKKYLYYNFDGPKWIKNIVINYEVANELGKVFIYVRLPNGDRILSGNTVNREITGFDIAVTGSNVRIYEVDAFMDPEHDTDPPLAPTHVTATPIAGGKINLEWTASGSTDTAGYNVYRNGYKINSQLITTTSYTASGHVEGQTYQFFVQAVDAAGNTSNSDTISVTYDMPPAAPTGLTSSPQAGGRTILRWSPNSDSDLAGYYVYRNGQRISDIVKDTSYEASGLAVDTEYTFYVTAVDAGGHESAPSAAVTYHVSSDAPDPPSNVQASVAGSDVTLTWDAPDGAVRYNVYRDGQRINTQPITATTYTIPSHTVGQSYTYTVRAVDAAGRESVDSEPVTVTIEIPPGPPDPVKNLRAYVFSGSVRLMWSAENRQHVDHYEVWRDDNLLGSPTDTQFAESGLTNNTQYVYVVYAVNDLGKSLPAQVMATPRDVPVMDGLRLPFDVPAMIDTASNFLALYGRWVLLALGVIFAPVLYSLAVWLVSRTRRQKPKLRG